MIRGLRTSSFVMRRWLEHAYLSAMVGLPLLASVWLTTAPAPEAVAIPIPIPIPVSLSATQPATAPTHDPLPCSDDAVGYRYAPTEPGRALGPSAALDRTWTDDVTGAVRAVLGPDAPVATSRVMLGSSGALIVATGRDPHARTVTAFEVYAPEGPARAHRVCGVEVKAARPLGDAVEVQLDDGSAVLATPTGLVPAPAR